MYSFAQQCLARSIQSIQTQRWWLALAITYTALSVWLLLPSPSLVQATLPVPTPANALPAATVPLLNSWTIWWNATWWNPGFDLTASYWNAPIFHPEQGSFSFSEPQPATLLLAPLVWLSESPYAAYWTYLIVNLAANAFAASWLLRWSGMSWLAALAGGLAMLLHPLAWDNLNACQLLPLWPSVLVIGGLLRTCWLVSDNAPHASRRWHHTFPRNAILLGLATALVGYFCFHHLIMLAFVATPACVLLIATARKPLATFATMAVASLVAGALLSPFILPMQRIHSQYEFTRSEEVQRSLSATASQWFQQPRRAIWDDVRHVPPVAQAIFNPGWLRIGLAVVAISLSLRARRHRRLVALLAVVALASIFFSLGANLRWGSFDLWRPMKDHLPYLSSVRSLYRFAYFAQLAILLLAAVGVEFLWQTTLRWFGSSEPTKPRLVQPIKGILLAGPLLAGLIIVEVPPPNMSLVSVPNHARHEAWLNRLRDDQSPGAVLCLPMPHAESELALETEARWMLVGTGHHRPLLNGYSGFFPSSWFDHRERFGDGEIDASDLDYLQSIGVRFIVLDSLQPNCPRVQPDSGAVLRSEQHLMGSKGIELWELPRLAPISKP